MARTLLIAAMCGVMLACGSSNQKDAKTGTGWDLPDADVPLTNAKQDVFELDYAPLTVAPSNNDPGYTGVSILGGLARLSRPADWRPRRARRGRDRTYIEYVSPHGYLFAIYRREDGVSDSWKDIEGRYEENAKAKGVEFVQSHVPFSVKNADGRAYILKRPIKGQRGTSTNTCREYLLRGEHNVLLVQVVHQGDTPAAISNDIMHVLESLEVK